MMENCYGLVERAYGIRGGPTHPRNLPALSLPSGAGLDTIAADLHFDFMTAQRPVAKFEMEIRSECDEGIPQIQKGDQTDPMLLPFGERRFFSILRQVSAGQRIFRFRLLPPLEM